MKKSIFHFWDMDHTLIANDCDVSWKKFLINKGLAPENANEKIDLFAKQYAEGRLDQEAFFQFQLSEFKGKTIEEIRPLAQEHFDTVVKPFVYPKVFTMLEDIREKKNGLCLITSTNRMIAEPLASYLDFIFILATELESKNNVFTGKISGSYCGGEGKIPYIKNFCQETNTNISDCYYYGDSLVDIPIFEAIGNPVVVNPAQSLKELAMKREWRILNLRLPS